MCIKVIALDLERTLVTDAMTAKPRPGLYEFLEFCHEQFERVAIYTTVEEADAREIMEGLARAGLAPTALVEQLEYIDWSGEYKDLRFVSNASPDEILFVDDDAGWIPPDQKERWIAIEPWDGDPDVELNRVREILERRRVEG